MSSPSVQKRFVNTPEWVRVDGQVTNRTLTAIEVEVGESCCSKADKTKITVLPFHTEPVVAYVKASVLMAQPPFRLAMTVKESGRTFILNQIVHPTVVEDKK